MKRQRIEKKLQSQKFQGFSLIEVIITVGIFLLIGTLTTPIVINMYNTQENQSVADEIVTTLKKAQAFALLKKNDDDFSVKFDNENNKFILLEGVIYDSNDTNNQDGNLYQSVVSKVPDNDIVTFQKGTGHTASSTITVTFNNNIRTIFVCENGLVDYETCD